MNNEIIELVDKCLSGTASNDEREKLENWINASIENKMQVQQIRNMFDVSRVPKEIAQIDVDEALKVVMGEQGKKVNMKFIRYLQKVAAILLLPLLALSFLLGKHNFAGKSYNSEVYSEISASFGTRSSVILSDGTKVYLNSGSTLRYPEKFSRNIRKVFLIGEGYFEVKASKSKPFEVHTKNMNVRATGTKFNVDALCLDGKFEVSLVEGKVNVFKQNAGKRKVLAEMHEGQHFRYDTLNGTTSLVSEDPYKYIAWKDGKLIFRNEAFGNVIKKIGYFYNVDIELKDSSLNDFSYRATFEEENIDEILKLLKLSSPIRYTEEEREILEDGTFPKKKINIYAIKSIH